MVRRTGVVGFPWGLFEEGAGHRAQGLGKGAGRKARGREGRRGQGRQGRSLIPLVLLCPCYAYAHALRPLLQPLPLAAHDVECRGQLTRGLIAVRGLGEQAPLDDACGSSEESAPRTARARSRECARPAHRWWPRETGETRRASRRARHPAPKCRSAHRPAAAKEFGGHVRHGAGTGTVRC